MTESGGGEKLAPVVAALAVYVLVVAVAISRHEPWADEAQAWLLGRDTSLADLWTTRLHYEGTPGLWHSLLHVLIRAGAPYAGLNVFSGALGVAAAWLVLRYAQLPLAIRISLPFTFFLAYQYSVVARSYSLLPVLLFACAIVYRDTPRRPGLFAAILSLMAVTSVHGFALSAVIAASVVPRAARGWRDSDRAGRRRLILAASAYLAVLLVAALSAWPAPDMSFPIHPTVSIGKALEVSTVSVSEAFAGQPAISCAVIALSIPLLWRGRGLFVFVVSTVLLCAIAAFLHSQVWHQGLIWLAWLFAVWISAARTKPGTAALAAFAIVIAVQCYWLARSVYYDWNHPYSGSLEAARYLQRQGLDKAGISALGYSCTALQPYFRQDIFRNWNGGGKAGFWEWSNRNRANDASTVFLRPAPAWYLAGYKDSAGRQRWANLLDLAGYEAVKHFEGNLYWRTSPVEEESFDLYRRASGPGRRLASRINVADPAAAPQLLDGFYDLESNTWRWTARRFAAVFGAPAGAGSRGARLEARLFIPDGQILKLGPMTLSVSSAGRPLAAETFSMPGRYVFSAVVPPISDEYVLANFSFDKASAPSPKDARELGAVVTDLSLTPAPIQ